MLKLQTRQGVLYEVKQVIVYSGMLPLDYMEEYLILAPGSFDVLHLQHKDGHLEIDSKNIRTKKMSIMSQNGKNDTYCLNHYILF